MAKEAAGAAQTKVQEVVPMLLGFTDLGGSGRGGAKQETMTSLVTPSSHSACLRAHDTPSDANPNLQVHWKLPIVLVQSEVEILQLWVPQPEGVPVHSLHRSRKSSLTEEF